LIIFIGGLNKLKIMKITEKITITNEDCMDLLRRTPDKFYQLAIIDPPYGINISSNPIRQKHKKKNWDSEIPNKEYFDELFRVSENQIIWGGNYFIDYLNNTQCFIIWDKKQPENFSLAMCELAWTSMQSPAKIFRYSVLTEQDKIHPTQKPVALYKWLLDKYAKQGDKILDTHLGSGSIAIACHDYGFELTACELDVDYYNKAIERIKNHISQIKLEL
jgi:site-specific DNA-methyltransferase (adenine-specific)